MNCELLNALLYVQLPLTAICVSTPVCVAIRVSMPVCVAIRVSMPVCVAIRVSMPPGYKIHVVMSLSLGLSGIYSPQYSALRALMLRAVNPR